jgi:tetratricopeptide (TPR) repeat protein
MNILFTKIQEATQDVQLTTYEKEALLGGLKEYMAHMPLRVQGVRVEYISTHNSLFSILFKSRYITGALAIALMVTTGTAGVSYAATDALPGDLLYPVKVRVNEEVKTALLNTDEARIEWERERAELRLEEASQLAKEGRLSPELSEEVLQYFAQHAESVVAQARTVGVDDPFLAAEVTDEFENALDAHEAVLARLTVEQEDGEENTTRELVTHVHSIAVETAKVRDAAEAQIASEIAVTNTDTTPTASSSGGTPTVSGDMPTPAHMREQVVYRAEAKSREHLLRVQGLLSEVGQNEPIASEVRTETETALVQLNRAKQYEEAGDLRNAYKTYREVANSLQNVSQVLEMHRMFSIQIRSGGVQEVDHTPDTDIQRLFDEASVSIRAARTTLISAKGLDDEVYKEANTRIKDASADLLRGDIARSLGEESDARALYRSAKESAEYVQKILQQTPREDSSSGESHQSNMLKQKTPVIHLLSTHTDTTEILTGTIVGLGCSNISAHIEVRSSTTEQVPVLVLDSVQAKNKGTHCGKELKNVMFTISSSTPIRAHTLRAVVLDGVERPFVLREDAHTYGTDTVQQTLDETGVFERMFGAAQNIF